MSFKRRLIFGSAWSTAVTVANQFANFAAIAVVARQVGAADFGTVAIVVVTIGLTRELVTAGLPDYLIREKRWDEGLAASALIFQSSVALALTSAMALVGLIIHRTGSESLGLVFMALSPTYLLDGLSSVFGARLHRDLRFRTLALCGLTSNTLGAATAIATALAGFGLWALVLNRVVGAITSLILMVGVARWKPTLTFSRSLWGTLRRSWRLAAANLIGTANLRITDFVVGGIAGVTTLGVYQIAGKGLDLVLSTVVAPSQRLALTGLAAMDEPARMAAALVRILKISSMVAFPIFVGLAALSWEFVRIVFGPGWERSVAPMTLLTLVGAPALITYLLTPVLTAVDRSSALIRFAMVMTVISAASAATTASFGVVAVAAGFLVRSLLGGVLALIVLHNVLALRPSRVLGAVAPAATSAAVMFAVVTGLRPLTQGTSLYLQTGLLVVAGAATYLIVMRVAWPRSTLDAYRELVSLRSAD